MKDLFLVFIKELSAKNLLRRWTYGRGITIMKNALESEFSTNVFSASDQKLYCKS